MHRQYREHTMCRLKLGSYKPMDTKNCQQPLQLGDRHGTGSSAQPSGGASPAHTLTADFWPPPPVRRYISAVEATKFLELCDSDSSEPTTNINSRSTLLCYCKLLNIMLHWGDTANEPYSDIFECCK